MAVLQLDASADAGFVGRDLGTPVSEAWITVDIAFNSTYITNLLAQSFAQNVVQGQASSFETQDLTTWPNSGVIEWSWDWSTPAGYTPPTTITALQFYQAELHLTAGSPAGVQIWIDGVSAGAITVPGDLPDIEFLALRAQGGFAGLIYFANFKAGSARGGSDLYADDFSGDLSGWNDGTPTDATIISDPGIDPPIPPATPDGRVFIAFNDGPLVANPTWTQIDDNDVFPDGFVAGYDTSNGRQTLVAQTDTGTATVYLNDRDGLFDPRNSGSAYFGKLDGKQILLKLYDPVAAKWFEQFRGWIDEAAYVLDGTAVDANGDPINAQIQLNCVDVFDILAGYGFTPGLDGITPPTGSEATVYYAATSGKVEDRIIEILADVGIDSSRYIVASGNVKVQATKYDPDEAALTALRDACDAELPFIANCYVDRSGRFVFRGRYSRFDPDTVAAEPGSEWDFTRWYLGDQKAITNDSTHHRAQMRVLEYSRSRQNIVNAAICYPMGMKASRMPDQVFADTTSITDYGKHAAQPMSDLITGDPVTSGATFNYEECAKYAELLVKNQKDPREAITSLQVKAIDASDGRASATWAFLTKSDISHIANVEVGYPGGTGFTGMATVDDYYIEGRSLTVRPANTSYDYVELDLEVSPAVWSMDTHSVFPPL